MKRTVFAALALAAAATVSAPASAQGTCNRELLKGIADGWVKALNEGTPYGNLNLGEWVAFWQDLELGSMSRFFDTKRTVVSHRELFDTVACRVHVESTVDEGGKRKVLDTLLTNGFFGVTPFYVLIPAENLPKEGSAPAWPTAAPGQSRADLTTAVNIWLDANGAEPPLERQLVIDESAGAVAVQAKMGADMHPTSLTFFLKDGAIASVTRRPS